MKALILLCVAGVAILAGCTPKEEASSTPPAVSNTAQQVVPGQGGPVSNAGAPDAAPPMKPGR